MDANTNTQDTTQVQAAPAVQPQVVVNIVQQGDSDKAPIYAEIRKKIAELTGGKDIGDAEARKLFLFAWEEPLRILASRVKAGDKTPRFRIPGGLGSLRVVTAAASHKRVPSTGTVMAFGERNIIRYDAGVNAEELIPKPAGWAPTRELTQDELKAIGKA